MSEVEAAVQIDRIAFGAPAADFAAAMDRAGAVIVEDVLTPDQVDRINQEFTPYLEADRPGSTSDDEHARDFYGNLTKRVMSAVSLSPTYRDVILENDTIWDYAASVLGAASQHIRLSNDGVFEIHPGEKAQLLHRDGDLIPYFAAMGPGGTEIVVNMMIALSDITEEMGATRVIPGSHKWPATDPMRDWDEQFPPHQSVPVTVKAGTMYAINGRVVHGGGANRTRDTKRRILSIGLGPAWLMPEHAFVWSVSKELAATFSPRLRMATCYGSVHHTEPRGGSVWNFHFNDLNDYMKFKS